MKQAQANEQPEQEHKELLGYHFLYQKSSGILQTEAPTFHSAAHYNGGNSNAVKRAMCEFQLVMKVNEPQRFI